MTKFSAAVFSILLLASSSPAQAPSTEVFTFDRAHSLLDFSTRLVGFNRIRGTIGRWQGQFAYDPQSPIGNAVSFLAFPASISTNNDERDDHLRSDDFFDVERFEKLSFDGAVVSRSGNDLQVEGTLTIRDSTHSVAFTLELLAPEARDPFGNRRVVFGGTIELNRRDYGILGPRFWNRAISNRVVIEFEMAGRIWGYRNRGYGRPDGYYGPGLVLASDSGRFDIESARLATELDLETDSIRLPRPTETEVAVGRLVQSDRLDHAMEVLKIFTPVATTVWGASGRSRFEALLGELHARSGRIDEARSAFVRALQLDEDNTNAKVWLATLTPSEAAGG